MTPKKLAIVQSNYIPWKGYFDLINRVDEFIILDEVQFTKNDWRNINKIKSRSSIVVENDGSKDATWEQISAAAISYPIVMQQLAWM